MAASAPAVDAKLQARAYAEISRAVSTLIFDEPFYGHLLSGVNRSVSRQTQTAAVGLRAGKPTLFVNPEFFVKTITRKNERVAVVKHEVLHLLFKHIFRADWDRVNHQIFNIAADLVVNQFIGKKWKLPQGAVTLDSFPTLDLQPDQTVEWYYKRLFAEAQRLQADGQPSLFDLDLPCDHAEWGIGDSADGSIGRHEIAKLARSARDRSKRSYGTVPDPIRGLVDALIEELEPTVDWRRVLRMFSNSSRRTAVHNTVRRPSKRYGTYPGTKVKRFQRVVAAIDTSGSISDADLTDFFSEIRGMWRQGAEITIVECDQIVQQVWEYRGGPAPSEVGGRGGTAFDPVFDWVINSGQTFDGVIYLTDGHAQEPTLRPRCKVLWVLTPDGSDKVLTFGRAVTINR